MHDRANQASAAPMTSANGGGISRPRFMPRAAPMGAEGGRQTLPTIAGEAMFRAVPGMAGDETGENASRVRETALQYHF